MKRVNLNFFTAGVCVKVIESDVKIHVVLYFDSSEHKKKFEVRLPGGTIQCSDIPKGLRKVQKRVGLSDEVIENFEEFVEEVVNTYDLKVLGLPNKTNSERIVIREIFVNSLIQIEEYLNFLPKLTDYHRTIIEDAIKEETLRRELRTECGINSYQSAVENGFVKRGEHFQYPFLVLGSDAPDEYRGSADPDIEKSYDELLSNLDNGNMYPPHKTLMLNALNLFLQIYEKDPAMSPAIIEKVKAFLKPAN